ncbi:MAG: MBL fold metallo-hydrolase [Bacteroidota bacterium]
MNFEINMINVKDGDAIILTLEKKDRKALIVIDGGYKKYYSKIKKRLKQLLPRYGNKIDLLVCTHYDNDHLGGVEKILDEYHSVISEIWIHKIEDSLSKQEQYLKEEISRLQMVKDNDKSLRGYLDTGSSEIVLEAYKDLVRVVNKIREYGLEDITREVTRGDSLNGFEEFSVISPTKEYYNKYLEELKDEKYLKETQSLLLEQDLESKMTPLSEIYQEVLETKNPCELLETSSVSNSVSATNMVSIVTSLKVGDRKILFTGDSGIESFTEQNILDDQIKDIEFLDLSHHGSKNNTSKELLEHFNPEVVFVSAKNGKNRPDKKLVECLGRKRAGNDIYVTNENPETWYLKYNSDSEIAVVE